MKKSFVILMTAVMLFAFGGLALAVIEPATYNLPSSSSGAWNEYVRGSQVGSTTYYGYGNSTHRYGTWNSPYTKGVDGYNYNDPQSYVGGADQVGGLYTAGPHGGYTTTTHKCRECHAVHRASGSFRLMRADKRFDACNWCHGTGAGSGFNIQTDNDKNYTTEYNVGHTMGFGKEGKWKAPDDTYPAFTPDFTDGFSCFDCHSPHANPSRLLGYNDAGNPIGKVSGGKTYGIANPGSDNTTGKLSTSVNHEPLYLSGKWLLIKNPDREIAQADETINVNGSPVTLTKGVSEIKDVWSAVLPSAGMTDIAQVKLGQYYAYTNGLTAVPSGLADSSKYYVNKFPTNWDNPIGGTDTADYEKGRSKRNTDKPFWSVTEFCADCHDGNAGLHTVQVPMFSEDRALRNQTATNGGSYDLAYGHDVQPRNCEISLKTNAGDGENYGPNCRQCHRGSSSCQGCHASTGSSAHHYDTSLAAKSRTVVWDQYWRFSTTGTLDSSCSDDGFSWPHRTMGWKMLKDDLFGLNTDGTPIGLGQTRTFGGSTRPVHDLDSACLDCHNAKIWNPSQTSVILKGLP